MPDPTGSNTNPSSAAPSEHGGSPSSQHEHDDRKLTRGTGKRNRVHFACTECYRRKQKCNRQTPCQHCIARKIPERCRTFQPGEDANDIGSRLSRVEKLLEEYLPSLVNRVESIASVASNSFHSTPSHEHAGAFTTSPGAIDIKLSNRGSTFAPAQPQPDSDDEAQDTGRLSPKSGLFLGGMRLGTILDGLPGKVPKTSTFREPIRTVEGAPDVDEIMAEYGAPLGCAAELLGSLPSRSLCNSLLQHFFDQINWMRQPIPQQSLRESFKLFWESGPRLTAGNINIFALLSGVCAIASLSIDDSYFPQGPRSRILAARRYHYAARRALRMSAMMGREDLDQVVAWNLSCRFLLLDRRIGEAYTAGATSAIAGFSIGLHRDGTKLGLNPVETEARRRIWAAIYFFDRSICLNTGRPPVIDDRICDTLPPSETVDEDVFPLPPHPPKMPEGVKPPTPFSYTIHRHHIALLEGRILSIFQSLQKPYHVSDVLAIDKEICALQDNLPFYFRVRRTADGVECDTSLDSAYGFLNVHRFLIHTEINSVRMALHRPFLLRSASEHGTKYKVCRQACLDAALHDLELRNHFIRELKASKGEEIPQVFKVNIGTFKWFHSLLIAGILLLMDPWAPHAQVIRGHLELFTESHYKRPPELRDEMRDREAQVIDLFLTKMDEMQKAGPGKGQQKRKKATDKVAPAKRARSEDHSAGRVSGNGLGSGSHPQRRGTDDVEDNDEHATAGLLLGLGQQGRANVAYSGDEPKAQRNEKNRSYADLAGPAPSSHKSPDGQGRYTSASGDWPKGYPAANLGSVSGNNSPIGTPGLPTTGSSTMSPGTAPSNSASDDAQQIFDTWYKAEFAAASMPSYDDPFGGQGIAGMPYNSSFVPQAATANGPFAAQGAPGYTQALDGAQQQLGLTGTNWNIPAAASGSTHGFVNLNTAANEFGSSSGGPGSGSGGMTAASSYAPSVPPVTQSLPASGGQNMWQPPAQDAAGGAQSFDPAFWQELINKIVT